ncbi:MAG: hypothetical protein AAB669_02415 [Patescibacteria group bacterium]
MSIILKKTFLALLSLFILIPTAQAYSPPPAGNILLFIRQQARITIELPPKLIMTPDKLTFPQSGVVYTFNGEKFEPEQGQYLDHKVTVTTKGGPPINGSTAGDYFLITISGFKKDEPPKAKDFQLTFIPTVNKNNINKLEDYLKRRSRDTAYLSDSGCSNGSQSHICLKTITKVSVSGRTLPEADLFQTIPLKGIIVSGNSAALNGTLDGFIQSGTALAVGKSVGTVVDGRVISGYDNDRISPINWTNIGGTLSNQFSLNRLTNVTRANIYNDEIWNLNSIDKFSPQDPLRNTFSTPPEGRLWNIHVDPANSNSNGFYHIGRENDSRPINFSGAGTISVSDINTNNPSDIAVVIHGGVTCAPGTRFALVTKGDIIFTTPPNGDISIECGSYTSLNGNIIFGNNSVIKKGTVNGIFIAKGDILLPDPDRLTDTFNINPDTNILKNPPVLLRELLKIVFGVSS